MTPGYILADKYRLVSLLGRGGMGAVWRAERLEWGSPVAVKLLERASEARPDVLARFLQEARLAANLRSSHVVQVLDDGRDASTGTPFIVMELLEGETLAQRLARVRRLSPAETARVVTHVARALSLAHERGMVHRDLKPDNIFLERNDDEEAAKVLDFGIAKWNVESLLADAPTTTGTAIGTPSYMSPEQIKDSKRVDHRTDLWSLALIASECLTGRRAFEADNLLSLALLICNESPPAPSSLGVVPAGVDDWFARATARDIRRRFSSARELAEELRRVCGSAPSSAERSAPEHSEPLGRAVYEPTEILGGSRKDPASTEGLTRTEGAVAAFRAGRQRARALAIVAAALAVGGVALGIRSELTPQAAAHASVARAAAPSSGQLPLRPLPSTQTGVSSAAAPARAADEALPPAPAAELPVHLAQPAAAGVPLPASPVGRPPTLDPPALEAAPPLVAPMPPRVEPVPTVAPIADVSAPRGDDGMVAPSAVEPAPEGPAADVVAPAMEAAPGSRRFDPDAARAALQAAANQAQSCRPPGGPHGRGRVQVRFEPSGKVSAAWLMTPLFDNTVTGSCVLMLFRRATIPEFDGGPEMVLKSFEVP